MFNQYQFITDLDLSFSCSLSFNSFSYGQDFNHFGDDRDYQHPLEIKTLTLSICTENDTTDELKSVINAIAEKINNSHYLLKSLKLTNGNYITYNARKSVARSVSAMHTITLVLSDDERVIKL